MSAICYFLFFVVALCISVPKEGTLLISSVLIVCLVAVYMGIIDVNGLIAIIAFSAVAYLHFCKSRKNKICSCFLASIFIGMTYCFVTHKMPGFNNPIVLDHVRISPISSYFSMNINFDKVICALLIFVLNPSTKSSRISADQIKNTIAISLACVLCLMVPAMCIGYIKFDPKIPSVTLIWAINNLCFVSFSEEVIFRGYVQDRLSKLATNTAIPILLSSVIFGLCHVDKGVIFVILAAICGLFYGYAFYRTQNVLCSTLVHFLLNFCHFIWFTYPHYLRA